MANRLAGSLSPYLLQHAENPVDWFPWGSEAFDEARRRDVPLFVSIGYASCHWCHVMAHESFEDPETAEQLNRDFVSVKVDREERPDVDAVYMAATTAMTGSGGWPMSVWLDHDGRVFLAGTYFPPQPAFGRPSFGQVLAAVAEAWQRRRAEVLRSAASINEALAEQDHGRTGGAAGPLDPLREPHGDDPGADRPGSVGQDRQASASIASLAVAELAATFEPETGGFGGAPKFPQAMVLEFLLRHAEWTGARHSLEMVERTCEGMARGGIDDQLAGGFARYSVDARWQVPHFEKMLYDNALLLRVYTHLWCRTDSDLARRVAGETAEFIVRDLGTDTGGFASALDADAAPPDDPAGHPQEGASYAWTPDQLDAVLGPEDGEWAAKLLGVTITGTFEHGTSTLTLRADPDDLRRWESVRRRLLSARNERPQPTRDDKIVASWNGLAITSLARAGVVFDEPAWVGAAESAARVLVDVHLDGAGRLLRVSRGARAGDAPGMLDDYGNIIEAFATLFAATGDSAWYSHAAKLTDAMVAHFSDGDGFADSPDDGEQLVRRPRDPADNATPSGASAAITALLVMSALSGRMEWRERAEAALGGLADLQQTHPRFAGWSLAALVAAATGPVQVAVVGDPEDPATASMLRTAFREARCGAVVARGTGADVQAQDVELLRDRIPGPRGPAGYVCEGFACRLPVSTAEELAEQLENVSAV